MSEFATLVFRAKRTDSGGYKVPTFTSSHVVTPRTRQGTRHVLMFSGQTSPDIARSRQTKILDAHGIPPYYVSESDARPGILDIKPLGSGFMAAITITVDLCAK